ncbi:MAG: hypothetical protein ABW189_04760 [Rickettsiales bacterium]
MENALSSYSLPLEPSASFGVREAVGVFGSADALQRAVDALESAGFERRLISVLGSDAALRERFGTVEISSQLLEDHPDAPRSPDVKKEELGVGQGVLIGGGMFLGIVAAALATGGAALGEGATASLALVAGAVGGAAIGAASAKLLGDRYAAFFKRRLDRGGLLLWAATPSPHEEEVAKAILAQCGATDVHVHEFIRDAENGEVRCVTDENINPTEKLRRLIGKHARILEQDKILSEKIADALSASEKAAQDDAALRIEDAMLYARDMAEEEQRIVAECHASACGNEEKESERYFSLVHDLKSYAEHSRHFRKAA